MAKVAGTFNLFKGIFRFYRDGFRSMTLGRTLWKLIAVKLIIMFCVLKVFFFQGFLESNLDTEEERAAYVMDQLTQAAPDDNRQQEVREND
jgi:uncharacterized membrane-anchored protein